MGGMFSALVYILVAFGIALLFGGATKPQAIGWVIAAIGLLFLVHSGIVIAIIWAHNNEVPPYINVWALGATIPVGLILVCAGLGVVCVRHCILRARKSRK
jgi:hypothetical protein